MKLRKQAWCRQMILVLLSIGMICCLPMQLMSAEQSARITEFMTPVIQEFVIHEKKSEKAVLEQLPKTLEARNEKNEIVYIPVEWQCVGDYEETNYYYYQFVPVVDPVEYILQEDVELPYIWIKISPRESMSRGVTSSSNETKVYQFLINDLKCNFATALGILANIERESTFNPKAQYPAKGEPLYYGICQWGSSRLNDLKEYCEEKELAYDSMEGQLAFLKHELHGTESRAWSRMQGIEDTPEGAYLAGYNWAKYFERCASVYYEVSAKRARDVYWPKYATEAPIERIFGLDRYETGFMIADCLKKTLGVEYFDNVIIATGKSFADALSGSYLAKQKNAPILLTNGTNNYKLLQYIDKNLKKNGCVYLLGGENALPEDMEKQFSKYQIKRLSGKTRYETNLEILKEAGGNQEELVVCTGKKFADSLSASASGKPILLVSNVLSDLQMEYMESLKVENIYIIGGETAVNAELERVFEIYGSVSRIAGRTRYETSILVAQAFAKSAKSVVLTYSKNFPDGLCGGTLAVAMKAPLILAMTEEIVAADRYIQKDKISSGYVLGGEKLISDDAVRNIFDLKISDRIMVYGN